VKSRGILFSTAHVILYRVVIPFSIRCGPLDNILRKSYKKLSRETFPVRGFVPPLLCDGLTIYFNPDRSSFTVRGLLEGTYERGTAALIRRMMHQSKTFIDLGANIGYFSLVAAQAMEMDGMIYSFEPDPDTYALLVRNIAANDFHNRIEAIPTAIADQKGTFTFHQYLSDAGSSSLILRELPIKDSIEVGVTTLDLWAEERGWPDIDFVKMDIEGAEISALRGMHEVSKRNDGLKLIIEFNAEALESASKNNEELFSILRSLGFAKFSVIKEHSMTSLGAEHDWKILVRRARWEPVNLFCEKQSK
jgi:FkbM family methyltransferase